MIASEFEWGGENTSLLQKSFHFPLADNSTLWEKLSVD